MTREAGTFRRGVVGALPLAIVALPALGDDHMVARTLTGVLVLVGAIVGYIVCLYFAGWATGLDSKAQERSLRLDNRSLLAIALFAALMWAGWQDDKRVSINNVVTCFESEMFADLDPDAPPEFFVRTCADYIWTGQGFYGD